MTDNLALEKTLWQAADKLRNNMDAAEYITSGRYIDFKEVTEDGIAFENRI